MSYDDKKFIGEKIRKARLNAGLTQYELAEKIGLTEKHMSNIERGLNFLALNNFFRLIEELGLSLEYFGVNTKPEENLEKIELIDLIEDSSRKEIKAYKLLINAFHVVVNDVIKK